MQGKEEHAVSERHGCAGNGNDKTQMSAFTPETGTTKNITYDNNGNMTSVTNSCGTTTYTWDVRNRLVGISGFDARCSPLSAVFGYDAIGRRTSMTVDFP